MTRPARLPSTPEQLADACAHAVELVAPVSLLDLLTEAGQVVPAGTWFDDIAAMAPPHLVVRALADKVRRQLGVIDRLNAEHAARRRRLDRLEHALAEVRRLAPEPAGQLGLLDPDTTGDSNA